MSTTTKAHQPQKRALQACNACKRRKVRCTGEQPCQQCQIHSLPCVYKAAQVVAASRSRLRVAERGTIIAESRGLDGHRGRRGDNGSLSPSSSSLPPPISPPDSLSTGGPADASRYDSDFFYNLVPEYMTKLYPISPVLDEAELRSYIDRMHSDSDAAALVYAYAALAVLLLQFSKRWEPDGYKQAAEFLSLAIDSHKPLRLDSRPSLARIICCLFIEMGVLSINRKELAFFYLREAISLMLMQGLDQFLGKTADDPTERARRERVYWLCFIHERHLAIEASTAICLDPLPSLPDVAYSASSTVGRGWNYIIQTFLVIDRDFVRFWTGDRSSLTAEWIQTKHRQFTDPSWELDVAMLGTSQQADLVITRQWLRTLTWQMAMSKVLLSSEASRSAATATAAADDNDALSLSLPLRLSSQLKACLTRMSRQGVAVDGVGLFDKLFEITTTIADVLLTLPPGDSDDETRQRIQDFLFAKHFFLGLALVRPIHRDILQDKVRQVMRLYNDARWNDLFADEESGQKT